MVMRVWLTENEPRAHSVANRHKPGSYWRWKYFIGKILSLWQPPSIKTEHLLLSTWRRSSINQLFVAANIHNYSLRSSCKHRGSCVGAVLGGKGWRQVKINYPEKRTVPNLWRKYKSEDCIKMRYKTHDFIVNVHSLKGAAARGGARRRKWRSCCRPSNAET